MRHGERGQVLPLWIGAIITTFMFAFLAINYGNTLRYQIRAQNAADSAAQALMAPQAERFNMMEIALYGTAVEEFRLRNLLQGIILASNDSGGCADELDNVSYSSNGTPSWPQGNCQTVYQNLTSEFPEAVNRYTVDAQLVDDYSSQSTWTNWVNDSTSLLTHLTSANDCNKAEAGTTESGAEPVVSAGADCEFVYKIIGQQQQVGLLAVQEDAQDILVPGLGRMSPTYGTDTENKALFAPGEIDVTACVLIPPVIPNFGPLHLAPQYAIGRAAARAVQFEQDWMQPGAIFDPAGRPASTFFQPPEDFTQWSPGSDTSESYDWYGINYGGNAATAYVNYGSFSQSTYDNEFSVRMGWWNSIAAKPFTASTGVPAESTLCTGPSSNVSAQ